MEPLFLLPDANTLERSAILTDRTELESDDLALLSLSGDETSPVAEGASRIWELEREAIERALVSTNGNRRLAAARLGIGLRTLYGKAEAVRARPGLSHARSQNANEAPSESARSPSGIPSA